MAISNTVYTIKHIHRGMQFWWTHEKSATIPQSCFESTWKPELQRPLSANPGHRSLHQEGAKNHWAAFAAPLSQDRETCSDVSAPERSVTVQWDQGGLPREMILAQKGGRHWGWLHDWHQCCGSQGLVNPIKHFCQDIGLKGEQTIFKIRFFRKDCSCCGWVFLRCSADLCCFH